MQSEEHPSHLGKYVIKSVLGEGAMGVVYRGEDPDIGREVAVKVIRVIPSHPYMDEKSCLQRFQFEARSAGNLRHPNIVTIFDVAIDTSPPYLVMDFIDGVSLEAILSGKGRIDPYDVMFFLHQIAQGLDYAHSKGVIHRDIKPANVLIGGDSTAYILDFGVATITGNDRFEQNNPVVGSPAYMSPEQIMNEPIDNRTDVFSLAVVAFECLTGKRPFDGENFTIVAENILKGSRHVVDEYCPEFPLALEAEFERALNPSRTKRFRNATTMIMVFCDALGIKNPMGGTSEMRGYSYVSGGDKNADVFKELAPKKDIPQKVGPTDGRYQFGDIKPINSRGRFSTALRIIIGLLLLIVGLLLVLQETSDIKRLFIEG